MKVSYGKYVISVILSGMLVFSWVPANAFGAETKSNTSDITNVTNDMTSNITTAETNGFDSNTIYNSTLTATVNASDTVSTITLKDFSIANKGVKVAVGSEEGGQADLQWYNLTNTGNTYSCSVPITNHRTAGIYDCHAYYVDLSGKEIFCNYTNFKIRDISAQLVGDNFRYDIGSFDATLTNIVSPSGIYFCEFEAWPKGSSDMETYKGLKKSDNPLKYYAQVHMQFYKFYYGDYQISATLTAINGVTKTFDVVDVVFNPPYSSFVAEPIEDQSYIEVKLNEAILPNGATVQFAVGSESGGQDDLVGYKAIKNTNNYYYKVPVSNHKSLGKFQIHAVITNPQLYNTTFATTTCIITNASYKKFSIVDEDIQKGTFTILMEGISADSGVKAIEFATGTKYNGQDDLIWHKASLEKSSDDLYNAEYVVNIANHKNELGLYIIHAYITTGNGIKTFLSNLDENFFVSSGKYNASLDSNEQFIKPSLEGTYIPESYKLYFAIGSENKGQDDLKFYETNGVDGVYKNSINLLNHRDYGTFNAHVVIKDNGGHQITIKGTTFYVHPSTCSTLSIENHLENGFFTVVLDNIVAPSGLYEVQCAVGSEVNGQDDLHGYNGTIQKKDKNSFMSLCYINLGNHGCYLGNYCIHVYITAVNGARNLATAATKNINMSFGEFNADISSNELYINTSINNAEIVGGSSLRLAVGSENKGQDDLKGYGLARDGKVYKYDVPILDHRDSGKYNLHVYLDYNGSSKIIFATSINYVTKCKFDVDCFNIDQKNGTFEITCYNVNSPSGIYKIQCPTGRSTSTSGTSIGYDASKTGDKYVAKADVADHEFYFGKYITHVYLTMVNGVQIVKALEESISPKNYFGIKYYGQGLYKMCIDGFDDQGVTVMKFPTGSTPYGQDDIQGYVGNQEKSGRWTSQYSARAHWPAGEFNTHVYAYSAAKPKGQLIAYKVYDVPEEAVATPISPLHGIKNGIDVSEHQNNIDGIAVANSWQCGYAMIRAGFGTTRADYHGEVNYQQARSCNIPVGAYWYSYAESVAEAEQEAYKCLEVLGGRYLDLPVAFDLEQYSYIGSELNTAMINAFCRIISAHGYTPMVYASESWYNGKFNVYGLDANINFGVAQGTKEPIINRSEMMRIGQTSSSGSVSGISGSVDTNWLYY